VLAVRRIEQTCHTAFSPRVSLSIGEIAIFAKFTKSTGSSPPFFFCPLNRLRMGCLLRL
jgi:hypothetical protein